MKKVDFHWSLNKPVTVEDPELSEYEITRIDTIRDEVHYSSGKNEKASSQQH